MASNSTIPPASGSTPWRTAWTAHLTGSKTALIEYLDREEAALKERKEYESRWARYQDTGQKTIPQDRVMAWLEALALGRKEPCPE